MSVTLEIGQVGKPAQSISTKSYARFPFGRGKRRHQRGDDPSTADFTRVCKKGGVRHA
jgi:hypothetical protein